MDPNDKIQLDDITFDDVIAGDGMKVPEATTEVEAPVEKEEVVNEEPTPELEEIQDEVENEQVEQPEEKDEEEEVEEDVSDTVVSEILEKLGYEADEEYEDTADGLADMTKEIASKMADDRIDEVLKSFPLVKEHLEYVLAGGESQNFMKVNDPNLDFNTMEIAQDDIRNQKAILSEYFTQKGHDKSFIKEDDAKLFSLISALPIFITTFLYFFITELVS